MWEYKSIKHFNLQSLTFGLNELPDWEVLVVSESRHPSDPEVTDRMWWSSFEALLRRKKPECIK